MHGRAVGFPLAVLAAAGVVGTVAACTASPSPQEGPRSEARYEVERYSYGGLCPEGPCGIRIVVGDEGSWTATGFQAPEPGPDELPPGAATRLAEAIEARWDALTAEPFRAACPTVYDGQEVVWTVRRLPSAGGSATPADTAAVVRELASCTWDLEADPAAAALDDVRALWEELGLPARW